MTNILTVSSTKTCKRCPYKYRLRYGLGIRPVREAKPLRKGSAWHLGLELLGAGESMDFVAEAIGRNYADRPD